MAAALCSLFHVASLLSLCKKPSLWAPRWLFFLLMAATDYTIASYFLISSLTKPNSKHKFWLNMKVTSFLISHLKELGVKYFIYRILFENEQRGLKIFKSQKREMWSNTLPEKRTGQLTYRRRPKFMFVCLFASQHKLRSATLLLSANELY